jgi:antitoxin YefM
MAAMKTTSSSELRRNLAAFLDSAVEDHTPIIVTRGRGKPAVVLMSLEDYVSYEETRHLLRNPRNAERLLEAVKALDHGEGTERELIE